MAPQPTDNQGKINIVNGLHGHTLTAPCCELLQLFAFKCATAQRQVNQHRTFTRPHPTQSGCRALPPIRLEIPHMPLVAPVLGNPATHHRLDDRRGLVPAPAAASRGALTTLGIGLPVYCFRV